MAALVGADGDGVGVLLDGGAHDVGDAAVVAQVHHFRAVRLQQAPDHVDGGVVPVEQGGGGDEAQRRLGGKLLEGGAASEGRRSWGLSLGVRRPSEGSDLPLRTGKMATREYGG